MGLFDGVEGAYYSFLDKLEPYTGINEWFVNPLESKGIPSLPVFLVLVLLLAGGLFFLVTGGFPQDSGEGLFKVSVSSNGEFVEGARVKLTVDGVDPFFSTTAENGVAVFKGVPEGATGVIEVTREGFDNFIKTIDLSASVYSVDLSTAVIGTASSKFLRVFVQNLDGEAVSGVRLVYTDPISSESVTLYSDATGGASVAYSLEDEIFSIRASADAFVSASFTCLATQTSCVISLKAKSDAGIFNNPDDPNGGGIQQEKGDVIVYVQDEEGSFVAARVLVYDADSAYLVSQGSSSLDSPAFMEKAAAVGTRVYVSVVPDDDAFAEYNGFDANDVQTVFETTPTEFRVALQKTSEVDLSELLVLVTDADNAPLDGAEVSAFFLESPEGLLATEYTNDDGEATITKSADAGRIYLTVFKEGFLPQLVRDVNSNGNSNSVSVSLTSLAPGNNGAVKAIVKDEDGIVIESALVKVFTADGFNTGVPEAFSLEDGSALFQGLLADDDAAAAYSFRAFYGSSKGQSDLFTPLVDEVLEVSVVLKPAPAFILVNAIDATNGDAVAANVSAYAGDGNGGITVVSSCRTSVNSSACQLEVPSGKEIILKASAIDYAPTTSEVIVLTAGERASKELKMIPLSFSNRLNVLDFKLEKIGDESGLNISSASPGGLYKAILTAVLPSGADSNGLYLRVGEKASAGDDFAYFTFFNQPQDAEVTWSSSYAPGDDCAGDLQSQTQGKAKWLDYKLDGKTFGVYSIAAKLFVEPTASLSDKLRFDYRVYSIKKDVYSRKPFDNELNYSRKIAGKDYCYADTYSASYPLAASDFECNENACISTYFTLANSSAVVKNGLSTKVGDAFKLYASVKTFAQLSSPLLKISTDEPVQFLDYAFTQARGSANASTLQIPLTLTPLDEAGESAVNVFLDSGVVNAKSLLPTPYNKIVLSLVDGSEEVLSTGKYVVVNGVAQFTASVVPTVFYAHEQTDLKITVKRKDDNTLVTDARVTLEETSGYPFDGFPNGGNRLQGDGTAQNGENGEYVFKRLRPTSTGLFNVVIERLGFTPMRLQVRVDAKDFLEFSPDPNDLRLSCDSTTLSVSTTLDVDAPVTTSFSGSPCVAIAGPGVSAGANNSYSFTVKTGKSVPLLLTPTNNSACFIVFNSVLPGSGSVDSKTAFANVDCPALNPVPTPTPSPNATSLCSSSNCLACGETECKNLTAYCSTNYITLPNQSKVFNDCTQLPNATSLCSPTNCGACKEQECLSLQQQKKCMPEYYVRTQASGQSGQCSQTPGYGNVPGTGYPNTGSQGNYPGGFGTTPFGPQAPVCREYRQCTPYKAPQCAPANFNFQSIFTRRLAQYHANLLLNPTLKNQQIAREAGTTIVYDMNGLHVSRAAKDCTTDGKRSITCERKISSILPTNALAFSIYNQFGDFGARFGLKMPDEKAIWKQCFKLSSLDSVTVLQKIANVPGSLSELTGIAPHQRFHTWVIQFLPKKECINYYITDEGWLGVEPVDDASEVKLYISPFSQQPGARDNYGVTINLKIVEIDEKLVQKYALLYTPFTAPTDPSTDGTAENAFFVNNLQTGQNIVLDGNIKDGDKKIETIPGEEGSKLIVPSQGVGSTRILLTDEEIGGETFKRFKASVSVGEKSPEKILSEPSDGIVAFDPLAYEDEPALKCSDDACCLKNDFDDAFINLKADVNEVYKLILSEVETVYAGNIVDGHADLFNRALNDAIADYLARAPLYQACLAFGVDPLNDLKNQCAQQLTTPLYADPQGEGFNGIYGQAFTQTACDSELLNYAFGFSQAYGPNFWNAFKNRLQGVLMPTTGVFPQKNYVVPIELSLQVVVKQKRDYGETTAPAGAPVTPSANPIQEAGIKLLKITAKNVDSPDGVSDEEWINLEGPKSFLEYAPKIIGAATSPVKKLTGCLAPYLDGTPDDKKFPNNRCYLEDEITGLKNYCVDQRDESPNKEKNEDEIPTGKLEENPEGTPSNPPSNPPESKPEFSYEGINLYGSKADCNNACNNGDLPPENNVVANTDYCAETYFAKIVDATTDNKVKFSKESKQGARRYWVCEKLFQKPKGVVCVPLRDVYSEASWSPTLCKDANRCHNNMGDDDPYNYQCCLKRGQDC